MSEGHGDLPSFTSDGRLPPYLGNPRQLENCSPYSVSLRDFARCLGHPSPNRRAILRGFLDHRAELHALGLVYGFQWINGSFVEKREGEPKDIDVVTIFKRPEGFTLATMKGRPDLFKPDQSKSKYHVDARFIDLCDPPGGTVRLAAFWSGLWSHRKATDQWKGFLQVGLSDEEDEVVRRELAEVEITNGSA